MTLRSGDLQSDSDLDSIRNSCDVYRFNAKKLEFFGVNFILQKFCPCKKNDKYQVCAVAMGLLCVCYVGAILLLLLLCSCYTVAMLLLCGCYVVATRLLCGCYVVAMRLLCCSCCCCVVAMRLLYGC